VDRALINGIWSMLSPVEALGLLGKTLDNRIRHAVQHVGDTTLARVAERLRADALANEIIYEHDGVAVPVRIMLRPLLATPEQLSYVDHVCFRLLEALKRLPVLYLENPDIRRILAITPDEDRWLRETWTSHHRHLNPIYGRLDAVCDFTASHWQESLKFFEPNLSGVGGVHYAPLAEKLVMRDAVPALLVHDPDLVIEAPRDQRELFVQVLIDHARAIGRDSCRLCFVEPKYVHEGPNEQSVLGRHLAEQHGLTIVHADPRELRVEGEEVFYEDERIDVVYRDFETRDLLALEREIGKPLAAMRLLFRQNRVVSSLVGDFDHKSCWELLTDETIAERFFTPEERRLFRRHVLWTRLVDDRKTTLPHGEEGHLLEYARNHRELLVLKPNRGYGGQGVTLGASVSPEDWNRLLNEAVHAAADPEKSWVLQSLTRLPIHEFPVVDEAGRVFEEAFYAVMGFASTENGLGIMCRVSQKQVVNVAQQGGLAAVLVAHPPRELRMPRRTMQRTDGAEKMLRGRIAELRHLDHTIGLLGWDEETMLPAAGRPQRGAQLATLEGMRHSLLVSDYLGDLIEEVASRNSNEAFWNRETELLRRLRRLSLALPEELVREQAKAKSESLGAWEAARGCNNFRVFAPAFERLVRLVRERAQALARGGDLYDALLDEYEPGMRRSRLEPVMAGLGNELRPRVLAWGESGSKGGFPDSRCFAGQGQWEWARRILTETGFDFRRGRLDPSTHPFTLLAGPHDVRVTIRIDERNPVQMVLTTLHEGGHALYDQGFLATDADTLVGDAPGMGMHESQARLWENHVGRNRAFWQHYWPTICELFPNEAAGLDADAFYRAATRVNASEIRVDADEVSYHLHILMRYEIELALLSGDIPVDDLKGAWNEKSVSWLGVRPSSDRSGVLQDVHWSLGMFGYFPSYLVGSLYAAQFAEAYELTHDLSGEIRSGNFAPLLQWLRSKVHEIGYRDSAEAIVTRVTGQPLDPIPFLRYLDRKYRGVND
jgi:carboxypeptidase Taq